MTRLLDGLERDGLVAKRTLLARRARHATRCSPTRARERLETASCSHVGSVRALFEERYTPEELETLACAARPASAVIELSRASASARTTSAGGSTWSGSRAVVEAALDAGVTHIDTADIYGGGDSERFIGEILEGRRGEAVIATKFGMGEGGNGSPEYVRSALDASLERLRTDYVDLLYYHRPDGVTPIAETVGAMHELVDGGQGPRDLGVSNVDAAQLREAAGRGAGRRRAEPVQPARARRRGRRPAALRGARRRLRAVLPARERPAHRQVPPRRAARRPARGSPGSEIDDETFDRIEALERFAAERGHTLLELAIGALASQPAIVSVIAGATTPEQVRANAAAAAWRLTPEELAALPRSARSARCPPRTRAPSRRVIDGRTSRDRAQELVRRRGCEAGGERALERGLRSLARRELDVRGGEVLRSLGELVDVDLGVGDLRDVAPPDARRARCGPAGRPAAGSRSGRGA